MLRSKYFTRAKVQQIKNSLLPELTPKGIIIHYIPHPETPIKTSKCKKILYKKGAGIATLKDVYKDLLVAARAVSTAAEQQSEEEKKV